VWHKHDDEDEMFLVVKGGFRMEFRDRSVDMAAGQIIVVPKGVEHRPCAEHECEIVLFERAGVVNTGDAARNVLTNPTERI
jgi:mannose-6-phosphate isomerase-like protein (cupin superfamily)